MLNCIWIYGIIKIRAKTNGGAMQITYGILYLEINLVSVIITAIILIKTTGLSRMASQRHFEMAIFSEIIFFLSDTIFVMMYRAPLLPYNSFLILLMKNIYLIYSIEHLKKKTF